MVYLAEPLAHYHHIRGIKSSPKGIHLLRKLMYADGKLNGPIDENVYSTSAPEVSDAF